MNIPETNKTETYDVNATCKNCGALNTISIAKGTTVGKKLAFKNCWNCGCKSLVHLKY